MMLDFESIRPSKILIIDDDEENVFLMTRVLQKDGYPHVFSATDPFTAADRFLAIQPDIVILDYRMPPVDGFYVLEQIQKQTWSKIPIPVLMLTSGATEETKQRALAAGVIDFLPRELSFVELLLRIRNALTTYSLSRQLLRNNASLEQRIQLRTTEIHQAHRAALAKLATASEFRDDQTGAHTRRVGSLAATIAESMGFAAAFVEDLRVAAPLHDVGKIGIPDQILLKPSKLTEAEYETVKTHSAIGRQILGHSGEPIVEMAGDIAHTHHERWDGRGYPAGLVAEAIPIVGRIVALADAYDAMTNDRPYRPAQTHESAVIEIKANSGRHFDPGVVEAFLAIPENRIACISEEANPQASPSLRQESLF